MRNAVSSSSSSGTGTRSGGRKGSTTKRSVAVIIIVCGVMLLLHMATAPSANPIGGGGGVGGGKQTTATPKKVSVLDRPGGDADSTTSDPHTHVGDGDQHDQGHQQPTTAEPHGSGTTGSGHDGVALSPHDASMAKQPCPVTTDIIGDMLQATHRRIADSDGTRCIEHIEPISGEVPFTDVSDRCYTNTARWGRKVRQFLKHYDFMAVERRRVANTRLLGNNPLCRPSRHTPRHKVYFDFWSKNVEGSIQWFLAHYPDAQQYLIHAYDFRPQFAQSFAAYDHDHSPDGVPDANKWKSSQAIARDAELTSDKIWFQQLTPWNETGYVTFQYNHPLFNVPRATYGWQKGAGGGEAEEAGGTHPAATKAAVEDPIQQFRDDNKMLPAKFSYVSPDAEDEATASPKPADGLPADVETDAPVGKTTLVARAESLASILHREAHPDDFVVMRMDVNGYEWILIEHLIQQQAFHYIDELFLVCHNIETDPMWRWNRFGRFVSEADNEKLVQQADKDKDSLADGRESEAERERITTPEACHRLVNTLRAAGVYVHDWLG